jgi:hypothetical protein
VGDGLDTLHSTSKADKKPPACPAKCPAAKKHWVGVKLRYKDDNTNVPAAKCIIHKGGATQNPGPLATGALKSTDLDPATYEVSFPEIHADEWSAG